MRVVVPDHRKRPGSGGSIETKGACTGWGIRPRATIGSEKTSRISFACSRASISPSGPDFATRGASAEAAADRRVARIVTAAVLMALGSPLSGGKTTSLAKSKTGASASGAEIAREPVPRRRFRATRGVGGRTRWPVGGHRGLAVHYEVRTARAPRRTARRAS
jgi:hypothetical protein